MMIANGGSSSGSNFTAEEILNWAAFLTTGVYAGPTAPIIEEAESPEKRSLWDYLSFLWLGPAAFLKGKDWAEKHEEEITDWAAYFLMVLIVIAIVLYLTKK